MEVLGRIVEKDDKKKTAQVAIARSTACGQGCASCGSCAGKEHQIIASNPDDYEEGQMVYVQVDDRTPLAMAFIVYMLPVIAVIMFCIVIGLLWGRQYAWLGFIAGTVLWIGILLPLNRRAARRDKPDGVIVGTFD